MEDLWPALIDPNQVEVALLNLVLNARDAMPAGGVLRIETANVPARSPRLPEEVAASDCILVAVSDTGSGMNEAVLARAFEPFFTTKSGSTSVDDQPALPSWRQRSAARMTAAIPTASNIDPTRSIR